MHHYRIYKTADGNRVAGPPQVFTCIDDEEAISMAEQALDGQDVEIWQGAHLVSKPLLANPVPSHCERSKPAGTWQPSGSKADSCAT
jgi:hypothetical protein